MVRKFHEQDMERVLDIWLEASIRAHHFIPRAFWESKLAAMRTLYLPNSESYVYELLGEVRGFISLQENTIAALFVAPDNQSTGIGTQLIRHAKALYASLRLAVYKENVNGIRFYKKCGFTVAEEKIDEHTERTELLMVYSRCPA